MRELSSLSQTDLTRIAEDLLDDKTYGKGFTEMQLKNQNFKGKEWRVVAAVTTVGALGFSGLALAGPGQQASTPSSIDLQDRIPVSEASSTTNATVGPSFTFPSVLFSMSADTTYDSPFDSFSSSADTSSPDTISPDTSSPDTSSPDTSSPDSSSFSEDSSSADSN